MTTLFDENPKGTARNRQIASEALERWENQLRDFIEADYFGAHRPHRCIACRSAKLLEAMADLRRTMAAKDTKYPDLTPMSVHVPRITP